jgi:hypothetical protein
MPNYTYFCEHCQIQVEYFFHINEYKEFVLCNKCKKKCYRDYLADVRTQSASIKKSDTELKTLGDLANRNRDKLTDDQKIDLHNKHNSYKQTEPTTSLPKGMSRIKKPSKKQKWT